MIRNRCPKCKTLLENPASMAGRPDKCPRCGQVYLVQPPSTKMIALGSLLIVASLGTAGFTALLAPSDLSTTFGRGEAFGRGLVVLAAFVTGVVLVVAYAVRVYRARK